MDLHDNPMRNILSDSIIAPVSQSPFKGRKLLLSFLLLEVDGFTDIGIASSTIGANACVIMHTLAGVRIDLDNIPAMPSEVQVSCPHFLDNPLLDNRG